ncbi:MAG TPA: nitronate monooxygenase [Cyclobacteriaceae bacterium]|nr:nitronate monooxygenase [Cyclobacteriaceae bacterium]HMV07718.1 nitronate monooxygenase [Cyclobacteriaceae bacterium]HMV88519.1 nitronate monooxygenase [Cyclobacteriaceae bacterium]HMW98853.1 nitronate monooxygenase [Cyclobacteriaceae bacterium]HMX48514.1 nitronate monooxygenase [Cyclobacteriaceae bacterium]
MNNAENRVKKLFGIDVPVIQAGMVWCSGWRLASAVSNAGGLGLIGAGSMYPDVFREHIQKCKSATARPFGVNVPLLYPEMSVLMDIIIEEGVKIVFTSAGNPGLWTGKLKEQGITVVHVVSSVKFAKKSEQAGVDAVVAEGFEAGGHNGREETTTLVLIPMVRDAISIPLIAAGGIAGGRAIAAVEALGAEGVQVGSGFAASVESSAHANFKQRIINSSEGDTQLTMKQLTPVRLIKNKFFQDVIEAEQRGASNEEMMKLLGRARAKRGMFEGDMDEGELEIGQVSATIKQIRPAADILKDFWQDYLTTKAKLCQ